MKSKLDEELRAYIEMVTEERITAGMSAAEARSSAMAEFGGVEQVKQTVRDNRAGTGTELLWQDVRYAFRQLRRTRGFTPTAVITMGFGIGAANVNFLCRVFTPFEAASVSRRKPDRECLGHEFSPAY